MKHFEYENVEFYMGENAKDNWDLLDKSVEINNNYIWFHLNSFSSPYVIMYSTIEELKMKYTESKIQEFLNYGAKLCKENSKYNFLNDAKILYLPLKKLKKGNKLGEVITSGKRTTIKV